MKRVGAVIGGLALLLVAFMVVRASTLPSRQLVVPVNTDPIDVERAAAHLAQSVRYATVSHHDRTQMEQPIFDAFYGWFWASYPTVFSRTTVERVGENGILLTWRGPGDEPPVLLTGHYDVVPVEAGTEGDWEHEPFGGTIAGGYVWGRGSWDDKAGVIGIMEAVSGLMNEGFTPRRTLVLAFGADEEVGGNDAIAMAQHLDAKGVTFDWCLDEGLGISSGVVPGLDVPVALIGPTERGYMTLEITAHGDGGHSSMPPEQTAVNVLATALTKLEGHPFPAAVDGIVAEGLSWMAPHMSFTNRLAFANLDLLHPVVKGKMTAKRSTNALSRTTIAPTMLTGSPQENVLPQTASAMVNVRLNPRDSQASALAFIEQLIDDERVSVAPRDSVMSSEASPVSSLTSDGFVAIQRAIHASRPDVIVAPQLVIGLTDARHYQSMCGDTYRFMPIDIGPGDAERAHGTNERVSVQNFGQIVRFYRQVIREAATP